MDKPKISVIVPIYKVEKYLVQCIDSIVNQTLKDIEIILVDEGDMDACRFIIDHYEQTDCRVKAIHEKNGGYGASVNKGFDIATGEYISIIESDDFIEPTMYEEMYEYAKKLDADVVKTPYYEYRDKRGKQLESKKICSFAKRLTKECPTNKTFSILKYPQLMGVHASLWSGIYKTAYIKQKNIRFIEAKGGAYVDVGFRIDTLINTDKVAWYNKAFYNYRLTNDSSTTNNFNLVQMSERWKEAHENFAKLKPEIYEIVGKELIFDEYLNSAGYLYTNYEVTQEDLNAMQYNYSFIPDSVVKESRRLNSKEKELILSIKNGEFTLEKLRKKKIFSCRMSLHLNRFSLHLFRYMKHNIIRLIFRISGLYVIDFCIGKIK